jgi:hypothetical protein
MKKISILITLALLLGLLGTTTVSASTYGKFPSYTSGIQVQNLAADPATVTLTYYLPDGSVDTTFVDPSTIPGYGSRTYFPIHASTGFSGSVVVSSDQSLAAISNILGLGTTKTGAASYVAPTVGSGTVSLPLLMKGNSGIDTWFSVQNIDPSADAIVDVTYSDGTTAGPVTIKAGSSYVFDQAAETHTLAVFAATVTADKDIAVVVIEETSNSILYAYTGFVTGTTNPVMPLINSNNSGNITGVQIQNAGIESTTVTVSYTPGLFGTACTETQTIAAGASATFALYPFAGASLPGMTTTCINEKFVGSAEVTDNSASQALIAVVNQVNATSGEAYGSFDITSATDTVVFPLIQDRNSGWFTGLSVMNVGDVATTIDCTFTNTTYTFTATIDPGEAAVDIQLNKIADKYVGAATCVASDGVPIVGTLNEASTKTTVDGLMVYEGINVP